MIWGLASASVRARLPAGLLPNGSAVPPLGTKALNRSLVEFEANSLAREALVYPSIWAGIWTSEDNVISILAPPEQQGRSAAGAFPALCTHRHAWPVFLHGLLAGHNPTAQGVDVAPILHRGYMRHALAYSGWRFRSARFNISEAGDGTWSGSLAFPANARTPGTLTLRWSLPLLDQPSISLVIYVSNKPIPTHINPAVVPNEAGLWGFAAAAANVSVPKNGPFTIQWTLPMAFI